MSDKLFIWLAARPRLQHGILMTAEMLAALFLWYDYVSYWSNKSVWLGITIFALYSLTQLNGVIVKWISMAPDRIKFRRIQEKAGHKGKKKPGKKKHVSHDSGTSHSTTSRY